MHDDVGLSPVRRVHPVSLFLTPKSGLVPLAARRDQHAALDIIPALMRLGFEYGEPILDYPPEEPPPEPVRPDDLYKVEMPFVTAHDVLLQTTRPPMHDRVDESRKRIQQSYTDLESRMFDVWEDYMAWTSRGRVLLHERLHRSLQPPHDSKRQMAFRQTQGAPYLDLGDWTGAPLKRTDESTERRTAVFLLRKNEAWPGGPGLIAAFGMDGTATAVWCYRLGRDLSHLLQNTGFVLAEMTNPGLQHRPTNMLCARNWKIEILLQCDEQ
ncbi:MAG: hypothetical protein AB7T59_16660 [Hyphomonadaceae bacterium]